MVNKKVLLDPDHKPAHRPAHTMWSSDYRKVRKELKKAKGVKKVRRRRLAEKKTARNKRKSLNVNMAVNVLTKNVENPKENFVYVNNVVHSNQLPTILEVEEDEEPLVEQDPELDVQVESPELDQQLEENESDASQEELVEENRIQEEDDFPADGSGE